ncbi:MAG TPA: T6SS immunity protein Tdi1 domain-containing protein [Kineosporiaceae bacterium]|nr:T6SS immunity protein Tdi1 domain-containing protein [Kineosporiaceae bacterium]
MLERFAATFRLTAGEPERAAGTQGGQVESLNRRFGGCTFGRGLYRVHTERSAQAATQLVINAFPEYRGRVSCFGFDWLGRQFALDSGRGTPDDPEVLMFEPGTGESLEASVPFSRFHDEELVDYTDDILAARFFSEWMSASGGSEIGFDQCVGYRTPLFLGGDDVVANLEVSDIDVYWTIMGQLRLQVMSLPPGTQISGVRLEND